MDNKAARDRKLSASSASHHSRGKRSSSGRERGEKESKHEDDAESRDRRIKRKARPVDNASVPGAHPSTVEHKSSRKTSSNRSSGESKDRSSRSRPGDDKSAHRSSRSPAIVPGAQPEISSQRTSRKRDEKGKERRGNRATKPGAESSTSSTKASGSGRSRKRDAQDSSSSRGEPKRTDPREGVPRIGEGGEEVIASMIVEEEKEDEDAKKEREDARVNQLVEKERQRIEAEHQRRNAEMEAERKKKERKKKRRNAIVCIVLVLLIGGGAAAFFALQGGAVEQNANQEQGSPDGPSEDPSTSAPILSPTLNPTDDPSSAPTSVPLKYEPPRDEECERISTGLPIDGEEEFVDRSFAIPMEVDLLDGNDIATEVPELESKIEKLLVPDLIGCSRDFFTTNRRLKGRDGHHTWKRASMPVSEEDHRRYLQRISIRYAIAKAVVTVTVTDEVCENPSPTCNVVTANLDLKVRGDDKIIFLVGVVAEVFPKGRDIRPDLELVAPFGTVVIGDMRSLDPTPAPTSENPAPVPSSIPTASPTSSPIVPGTAAPTTTAPTASPVLKSASPVTGPTDPVPRTPTPTGAPTTAAPSKAPTQMRTLAPTPTPPPTFAPQPGITPPPTPPPTKSPTSGPSTSPSRNPSATPSAAPSTKPSVLRSASPTIQASAVPSPVPSSTPTSGPTSSPTFRPTVSTPAPTSPPRLGFVALLKQDMATELSSIWNGANDAVKAVDGDYDTHVHTGLRYGGWWKVNLQNYYGQLVTVNKVTVWNRRDSGGLQYQIRLIGAVVKLYGAGSNNLLATSAPLTSDAVQTVDFGEVTGVASVMVQQDNYEVLFFAEIEAWGSIPNDTTNLAFTGLISQGIDSELSSIWNGANDAVKAVDGDYDTFVHTGLGYGGWWRVNLQNHYGQLATVNKVTVWNRRDSGGLQYQIRLIGAVVKLFGSGSNNLLATSAPLTSDAVQTVDFGEVTGVVSVMVQQDNYEVLFFAEIEAWGSIPNDATNLGLIQEGMVTELSSIWNGANDAVKAVDGDYDTFVHTGLGYGGWWKVNLQDYYGQLATVNKVTVWNRRGGNYQIRLIGAVVKLFGAGSNNLLATSAALTSDAVQTVDFGGVTGVASVMVQQDNYEVLFFAEIEVWGGIP